MGPIVFEFVARTLALARSTVELGERVEVPIRLLVTDGVEEVMPLLDGPLLAVTCCAVGVGEVEPEAQKLGEGVENIETDCEAQGVADTVPQAVPVSEARRVGRELVVAVPHTLLVEEPIGLPGEGVAQFVAEPVAGAESVNEALLVTEEVGVRAHDREAHWESEGVLEMVPEALGIGVTERLTEGMPLTDGDVERQREGEEVPLATAEAGAEDEADAQGLKDDVDVGAVVRDTH